MRESLLVVGPGSGELKQCHALWRRNSRTLGFFPSGAFDEYASAGRLLAAMQKDGTVSGYLLYRIARQRAVVVHLVISESARGRGVARRLFAAFRDRTQDCIGASLTCRHDFEANGLWPRLGFAPVAEKMARADGKRLVVWWQSYGKPNLFNAVAPAAPVAVVDSSVFFDFVNDAAATANESRALLEDWLQAAFTLAVTPELFVEILRNPDGANREAHRRLAATFVQVEPLPGEVDHCERRVTELLGAAHTDNERSDRRHLAYAIASDASTFVTRDEELLRAGEAVEEVFGVRICRPAVLINSVDREVRRSAYEPDRLDGSGVSSALVKAEEVDGLCRRFQEFGVAEGNNGLRAVLREAMARPAQWIAEAFVDATGEVLGLVVIDWTSQHRPTIRALRVRKERLGVTLASHVIWRVVLQVARSGAGSVALVDPCTTEQVNLTLAAAGFQQTIAGWLRVVLAGIVDRSDVASKLLEADSSDASKVVARDIGILTSRAEPGCDEQVERLIWPAKLQPSRLGCFIVPIQPRWAARLFEMRMASEELFGADSEILLRPENVYYRSAKPRVLTAPGRILWYVSSDPSYSLGSHICAASALTDVATGTAKEVFRRFRRFGVYTYDRVAQSQGPHDELMALTFSRTELLVKPLAFRAVQDTIFAATGKRPTFQGPLQVPEDVWLALYGKGARA